ncbi:MAG: AAA family ATPase, partial [Synergistaceae bacterium]|nr:AAA family ATPase [Synergistaceae bacterium]
MKTLPIGVHDFVQMRQDDLLYVDKTGILLELIENGRRYFLARPRRFGKSLTLSTLDAMFSGRAELFK